MKHSLKITIGIVDEFWPFRNGLITFLNKKKKYEFTFNAIHAEDLIHQVKQGTKLPQILLADMRSEKHGIIELMKWLNKHHSTVKVIGLKGAKPEENKRKLFELGCVGFLKKNASPEEYIQAIEEVVKQGSMSNCVLTVTDIKENKVELKGRETEFLIHACSEKSLPEISEAMNLDIKTIEKYNHRLHLKFDVRNRQGLISKAYESGLFKKAKDDLSQSGADL